MVWWSEKEGYGEIAAGEAAGGEEWLGGGGGASGGGRGSRERKGGELEVPRGVALQVWR